jgi:hypothetical protein
MEVVAIQVDVKAGEAVKQTETIKSQLKEAVKQAQALAAAGGQNTKEYANAVKKVAEVQDKMRNFNETLGALDPGKKFQAIAGVASGIAGGIQAATGMMALFGKESEDVQKMLLKVQAASAIAQGVDQVRDLGKYFNLAKVAINGGVQSLGKMRTALIATGVGAFAVALGMIVANFDEIKKAIDRIFPSLGGIGNLFDNLKKVAMGAIEGIIEYFKVLGEVMGNILTGEFSKAVDIAKTFGSRVSQAYTKGFVEEEKKQAEEREKAVIEGMIGTHNRQLKILEAQGKDTYALKKKILEEELRLIQLQKGKEVEEYKNKLNEIEVLEIEHQKKLEKIRLANWRKQNEQAQIKDKMQLKTATTAVETEEKQIFQIKEQAGVDNLASQKIFADEEIARKQQVADSTISLAQGTAQGISALGSVLIKNQEKQARFTKAMAIFQIGADAAQGISGIIKTVVSRTPDITGVTQAALIASQVGALLVKIAGATRMLNANSIPNAPQVSIPSFGGGGGGGSVNVPNINAPENVNTQVVGGGNNEPMLKAYVVESEITNSQRRIRGIEERATFG